MTYHRDTGDGDPCPQDPSHGRLWFMASKRQWCPSSRHTGPQFYEFDGTTPVGAPKSATEAGPHLNSASIPVEVPSVADSGVPARVAR